jgi:PAS domain S-box-containing protein
MPDALPDSSDATVRDAFRLLFERSSDTIMLLDTATMLFTEVNPAGLALVGIARKEDIVAVGPADMSPEFQPDGRSSAQGAMEMIGLAMQHGSHRFEWQCRSGFGNLFHSEIVLTCLDDRERPMMAVVLRDITERKANDQALIAERARLKATLDVALDCIVTIDAAGLVLDWNPAAEHTFGWSHAEVLGREMAEVIIPHDLRERHRQGMARAAQGEMRMLGQRIELRALHRDGHTFPVELSICKVETGGAPIYTGFIRDITKRKYTEELRLFRAVVESSPDLCLIVGMDLKTIYMNPACRQFVGLAADADETVFSTRDLLTPESWALCMDVGVPACLADGIWYSEVTLLNHAGEEIPASEVGILLRSESGEPEYLVGVFRDISASKKLQAQLAEANAELSDSSRSLTETNLALMRFKSVADGSPDFVCITNLQAEMLYMNPAGRKLLGHALDADLVGLSYETFATADFIRRADDHGFKLAMDTGFWQDDVTFKRLDGSEFPVSLVGIGIKSEDGTPLYFSGVCRDITERVAMEQQLRSSLSDERDLNELKTNFVNMISHEFRTPLGVIMSSTEILTKYFDRLPASLRQEHLNDVLVATKRMGSMMEEVLLLARADAGSLQCKPERMDLAAFCSMLVVDVHSSTVNKCPVIVSSHGLENEALADPALLRHIFTNLLNNAVKYSTPGVMVKLHIQRSGNEAIFHVIDQGLGIPEDDVAQLFTAFHRGSNVGTTSGTGLGLVIVKRCVGLHSGHIEVASVVGKGTTFTVTLPLFGE